ncbi:pantetheine-phosphate adenylyltransferase [Enemella sp. A6]|uniref:pantetheine-phosphate adenylyltransferase n=1 Tax=Enemella sp. A6 TaxID=3440152 RepID=UPI003EBDEF7E
MGKAICPGSFDPVTHGHLDIIERASKLFDEVIVGVGTNTSKNTLFNAEERVEMITAATAHLPNIVVRRISGLLVTYCEENGIGSIVKGLRFAGDFEYELQMAQMNARMSQVETILLPTSSEWSFISSTLVREIAKVDGDISEFVPDVVAQRLAERKNA